MTSSWLLFATAAFLSLPAILFLRYSSPSSTSTPSSASSPTTPAEKQSEAEELEPSSSSEKPIMSPETPNLEPPKDDPFTPEELTQYDGMGEKVYVAIKGTVFDVSPKKDMYGKGGSYNVFAGKDASRALGMSSLKIEDAVSDYSTLDEKDMKTLNEWYTFFQKRYNVVGKVVDPNSPSEAPENE